MIKTGLIKLFSSPITTATNTAVMVLSTLTPLSKSAAISTATDVINVFARKFFINYLLFNGCKVIAIPTFRFELSIINCLQPSL